MGPEWFKGSCPFFLTQYGSSFGRVEFDDVSNFIGEKVDHKDLRKIYTTDLKYHRSQVVLYF